MAAAHASTWSILSAIRQSVAASGAISMASSKNLFSWQLGQPNLPLLGSFSMPPAIHLNVPGLLGGLWDSVLRAVPKKKTSYSKKRSRFLAGKALKNVQALGKCPACGSIKRSHVLCSYCVKEIQRMWQSDSKA